MESNVILEIFTVYGFIKLLQYLLTVIIFIYVFYSFLVIRQVRLLNLTMKTAYATFFEVGAVIHFIFAVGTAFLAVLAL